ncbi:hypothetical protein BTM25_24640 [Actinomadura rubteroloni]|uniref:ABM domain-containing protein n=1 Tax=Actinomadura rubteroloni TaxID=1926885 RepID=A0A2P4UFP7_9ACTN|nr:hypothetical protein [Actinomadura rubteroloni]POM23838.1 hypothetical protein BTM25_24640 [Actinomadura rubteroloni]
MSTVMIRATVRNESVGELETAVGKMFAAIEREGPDGVRYASCKLPDGVTFVVFLSLDDPQNNPLTAIPEFLEFQNGLRGWIAGPPTPEPLTVLGSYRLF